MFLFMTAPVSAHLLCKAALHLKVPTVTVTDGHGERDIDDSFVWSQLGCGRALAFVACYRHPFDE
jgi:hypothetical protein